MPRADEAWPRVKEVFEAVVDLASDARATRVRERCAGDDSLRREVESLLASDAVADGFIERPSRAIPRELLEKIAEEPFVARQFGPYRTTREIGRGGLGTVYLAARSDAAYEKEVAIKLLRRGLDTEDILRRFRNERQILARLEHPHIARLIDGGTSEDGLPYFVMEYVQGKLLNTYCETHGLTTNERLQLFRTVCAAVTYAHQHLVIHRDLKPSNILVTSEGEVKLLDFGIAKLFGADEEAAFHTMTAQRVMTPEYASPEQVRGEAITTASDVYSLGVVLYELLTGTKPYRLTSRNAKELESAITGQVPERPSAAREKKQKSLHGDLDNIVLMALRKEPARRYESAAQFSEDIGRYLDGKPVIARKDTWRYRAAKYVRRNRVLVGASALILLSLVAGVMATAWQERATRQEKVRGERVNAFLEQMLNYSNPMLALSPDRSSPTTMTEVLDEAARRLESADFAGQPEVKADLERIISSSYIGQGKPRLAEEHAHKYLALVSILYGKDDPKTISASATRASFLFDDGKLVEAEKLFREVLPRMRAEEEKGNVRAEDLVDKLNNFAYLRRTQGDSHEAETLFRESLSLGPQMPREGRYLIGTTRSTLASTLADQGKFEEALRTAGEAVDEERQTGQVDTPGFGFSLTVLGGFLTENGNFVEADAALHEAEAIFHRLVSPTSLWLADNLRNQAALSYAEGHFRESLEQVTKTLNSYQQNFGTHYDNYPTALIIKGLVLSKTGQAQEGEAILREALKLRTDSLPKGHFWVALANDALGECLTTQGRYAEGEPLLLTGYNDLHARLGEKHPMSVAAAHRLHQMYLAWGKPTEAARFALQDSPPANPSR